MTTQPAPETPPNRNRAGRKGLLTPETLQNITNLISGGTLAVDACQAVDIGPSTFYAWLEKGRGQRRGRYREFLDAVTKAQAIRRAALLGSIVAASRTTDKEGKPKKSDWTAAAWVLQHTDAAMFSPQLHVHVRTELGAALKRLEQEFKNEPEILERAIIALTGGTGAGTPGADQAGEGLGNDAARELADSPGTVTPAARVPRPRG